MYSLSNDSAEVTECVPRLVVAVDLRIRKKFSETSFARGRTWKMGAQDDSE